MERFEEEELFGRADAIPLEMAPGDVILHAISAPHGSRANDSDTLRRVFYVHFMAREVLETPHPEWIGSKLGFGERGLARAREMLEEHERIGLPGPGAEKVELTPEGFVFGGEPATPPRHWEKLIGDLTAERIRAAKTLAT